MEYKFYAVVKNLLSKAGGTGFIPGRGTWVCSLVRELTYRTPWGNEGCVLPLGRPERRTKARRASPHPKHDPPKTHGDGVM